MPLTNCSNYIDEVTFSLPRNKHCVVLTPDIRTVTVTCEFNSSHTTGYQAILQAIDNNDINTLVVTQTQVPLYPLVLRAKKGGPHSVIVYPIMGVEGIVNSEAMHRELIDVAARSFTVHTNIVKGSNF